MMMTAQRRPQKEKNYCFEKAQSANGWLQNANAPYGRMLLKGRNCNYSRLLIWPAKPLPERHFRYNRQRIENRHYGWRPWSVKSLRYSASNSNYRRNNRKLLG